MCFILASNRSAPTVCSVFIRQQKVIFIIVFFPVVAKTDLLGVRRTPHRNQTHFLPLKIFVFLDHRRSQGAMGPPKFLEYLVSLRFERRYPIQNAIASLK